MWLIKYRFQAALVLLTMMAAWTLGYGMARSVYQNKISSLKAKYAEQTAQREHEAAKHFQAALAERQKWQFVAQQQSIQIAQMQQKLDTQAAQQQKEIPNVIQKDNSGGITFNGLGNDSLRHYRKSFGYTD
ncbi:hypothetical protein ACKLNO_03975 [Neisseriaceae bacterium B1]